MCACVNVCVNLCVEAVQRVPAVSSASGEITGSERPTYAIKIHWHFDEAFIEDWPLQKRKGRMER